MPAREREEVGAREQRREMHLRHRPEDARPIPQRADGGLVVDQPTGRAGEHELVRERVGPSWPRRTRRSGPARSCAAAHVPSQNTYGWSASPNVCSVRVISFGVAGTRSTPFGTTRIRSRRIAVCSTISSALNSETVMTTSARCAAAANPRLWNHRPRRVKVSGMVSGAASCAVTTSGTPCFGGTASDGACTRSTAPTLGSGPNAPRDVPGVVEHGTWERQDHGLAYRRARRHALRGRPRRRGCRAVKPTTSTPWCGKRPANSATYRPIPPGASSSSCSTPSAVRTVTPAAQGRAGTCSTCAATDASHVNGAACAGPRARRSSAMAGSSARSSASATAAGSGELASTAASPTNSSMELPRVVTSGAPHASASSAGSPKPSSNDGYATTADCPEQARHRDRDAGSRCARCDRPPRSA